MFFEKTKGALYCVLYLTAMLILLMKGREKEKTTNEVTAQNVFVLMFCKTFSRVIKHPKAGCTVWTL